MRLANVNLIDGENYNTKRSKLKINGENCHCSHGKKNSSSRRWGSRKKIKEVCICRDEREKQNWRQWNVLTAINSISLKFSTKRQWMYIWYCTMLFMWFILSENMQASRGNSKTNSFPEIIEIYHTFKTITWNIFLQEKEPQRICKVQLKLSPFLHRHLLNETVCSVKFWQCILCVLKGQNMQYSKADLLTVQKE